MMSVKSAAALAVVAGVAMSASASIKGPWATEPVVYGPQIGLRGAADGIGFEASEGYVQGDIAGQNGWLTNSTISAPRGVMAVRDGVNDGNGSANALRLSKGTQASGAFGIAQAPATLGSTTMTVDTRIDDNGGANYFVRGLIVVGTSAFLSFRVEFDYGGTIVLQDPVTNAFNDTLVPWVGNQWQPLTVSIGASTISYMYGSTSLGTTPIAAAGAYFDFVQFAHDNFQGFGGTTSFSGEPQAGYFDNVTAIPAPGAMALLGMGGLIAGRRRR